MGLSGQEYRSGLPYPTPGDLPDPGIEPTSLASPAFAGGFFTASAASAAPREEFVAAPRRREYRARTTRGSIRVGQQAEGQEECVGQLPHWGLRREGHSRQVRGCPSGSAPGHGAMGAVRGLAATEEGGRGGRWTVHLTRGRHDDGPRERLSLHRQAGPRAPETETRHD